MKKGVVLILSYDIIQFNSISTIIKIIEEEKKHYKKSV
jgi:hypothetical protein